MGLPSDTTFEIETTGSDVTCGGGFSNGNKGANGVDMTYGAAFAITTFAASLSATGTTTLISAGGSGGLFTNTMQGNLINITGQGVYCITGYTNSLTVTVDRNLGTFAMASGYVGGAFVSPGFTAPLLVNTNIVWQKAGTYLITSASSNISGGCVSVNGDFRWQGYQTTRGDLGTPPLLQASGISSATLFTHNSNGGETANLKVDGQSLSSIRGFYLNSNGSGGDGYYLTAINCTNNGIYAPRITIIGCIATGCSGGNSAIQCAGAIMCVSYSNTYNGFNLQNVGGLSTSAIYCLSYNNSGASSNGFILNCCSPTCVNCIAYNNGQDGFRGNTGFSGVINSIAEGNAGKGFTYQWTGAYTLSCAGYNNTGGLVSSGTLGLINQVPLTLTGSPFVNAASGNFALNTTTGAGASCRGAGIPGLFPVGLTQGYADIGAAMRALAVAGGSGISRGRQVMD